MHFQLGRRTGGLPSSIACLFLAWTIFNIELCKSASSVNLTSGEGFYYDVVCPPLDPWPSHDKDTVISAIERHRDNVAMARPHAETGIESPLFKSIFKSNKYRQNIVEVFEYTGVFFTWSPRLQSERPKIICTRTKAEADAYRSQEPVLWQLCTDPNFRLSVITDDSRTLFVCPGFFNLPDDSEEPQHGSCPAVQENRFADNAQGERFKISKTSAITRFALHYFDPRIQYVPRGWTHVQKLNAAIMRSAKGATRATGSYELFISLWKNQCQNVPDVDLPPWTQLQILDTNTTVNFTENTPLAMNTTLTSNSPDTLFQEKPPDTIGTS